MASTLTSKPVSSKKPHTRRHRTPRSMLSERKTCRDVQRIDELAMTKQIKLLQTSSDILKSCKRVTSVMAAVEHKVVVPTFKGRDAPTSLTLPHPGFVYEDTKESIVLRDTFRSLFGDKHYRFRISTALNMSSSGSGIVNSTISNSVLTSNSDFVSLSAVFNEYFVVKFTVHWMPVSRYQYPLGGSSTISVANLPIGKADLQHGQNAYSSLSALTENFAVQYHSTGDPFTDVWINTEKPTETVLASETAPTQSWNVVNNASNYQGTLQYLSQSAPPALPFTQVLGTFMAHWEIIMRVRT